MIMMFRIGSLSMRLRINNQNLTPSVLPYFLWPHREANNKVRLLRWLLVIKNFL
jgi:hypothetical protein